MMFSKISNIIDQFVDRQYNKLVRDGDNYFFRTNCPGKILHINLSPYLDKVVVIGKKGLIKPEKYFAITDTVTGETKIGTLDPNPEPSNLLDNIYFLEHRTLDHKPVHDGLYSISPVYRITTFGNNNKFRRIIIVNKTYYQSVQDIRHDSPIVEYYFFNKDYIYTRSNDGVVKLTKKSWTL